LRTLLIVARLPVAGTGRVVGHTRPRLHTAGRTEVAGFPCNLGVGIDWRGHAHQDVDLDGHAGRGNAEDDLVVARVDYGLLAGGCRSDKEPSCGWDPVEGWRG